MIEESIKLFYWDEKEEATKEMPIKELGDRLDGLIEAIKKAIQRLERISQYDLEEFEIKLSLKAGIFVISTEGAITLKYKR